MLGIKQAFSLPTHSSWRNGLDSNQHNDCRRLSYQLGLPFHIFFRQGALCTNFNMTEMILKVAVCALILEGEKDEMYITDYLA